MVESGPEPGPDSTAFDGPILLSTTRATAKAMMLEAQQIAENVDPRDVLARIQQLNPRGRADASAATHGYLVGARGIPPVGDYCQQQANEQNFLHISILIRLCQIPSSGNFL